MRGHRDASGFNHRLLILFARPLVSLFAWDSSYAVGPKSTGLVVRPVDKGDCKQVSFAYGVPRVPFTRAFEQQFRLMNALHFARVHFDSFGCVYYSMESSSHILGIGADFTKVRGPVRDIDIGFVGLFRLEGSGLLSPFVAKTKKKTEEQI